MEAALPAGRRDPLLESQVSSKYVVRNAGLVSMSNFWKNSPKGKEVMPEECPKLSDSGSVQGVTRTMAYSEKRYCPICKQKGKEKTTFICQASGCFCSVCGYRGKGEAESIKDNVDAR